MYFQRIFRRISKCVEHIIKNSMNKGNISLEQRWLNTHTNYDTIFFFFFWEKAFPNLTKLHK